MPRKRCHKRRGKGPQKASTDSSTTEPGKVIRGRVKKAPGDSKPAVPDKVNGKVKKSQPGSRPVGTDKVVNGRVKKPQPDSRPAGPDKVVDGRLSMSPAFEAWVAKHIPQSPATQREAKPASKNKTKFVKIRVGSSPDSSSLEVFEVSQRLLTAKAPGVLAAFNAHKRNKILSLSNYSPSVFRLFMSWLITDTLPVLDINQQKNQDGPFQERIRLYGLAEDFGIERLQDYTLTCLISNYRSHFFLPCEVSVVLAYSVSSERGKLRQFMAHTLAWLIAGGNEEKWSVDGILRIFVGGESEQRELRSTILRDVLSNIRMNNTLSPFWESLCHFHKHEANGNVYECEVKHHSL